MSGQPTHRFPAPCRAVELEEVFRIEDASGFPSALSTSAIGRSTLKQGACRRMGRAGSPSASRRCRSSGRPCVEVHGMEEAVMAEDERQYEEEYTWVPDRRRTSW